MGQEQLVVPEMPTYFILPLAPSKGTTELFPDYGAHRNPHFFLAYIICVLFCFQARQNRREKLNPLIHQLIQMEKKKKAFSTRSSFKFLFVLVIDTTFKSPRRLSLPLTIPYVDLSAI